MCRWLTPIARRATTADRDGGRWRLVRGFAVDPLVRWFFPDERHLPARAGAFFGYLFDIRVEHGEVYVAGAGGAASLWTPPDGVTMSTSEQDRRWADQVETGAGPGRDGPPRSVRRRGGGDDTRRAPLVPGRARRPTRPNGTGGSRAPSSDRCSSVPTETTSPVFLETAADNLPFYARFGFEELAAADLPDGPTVHALWRLPAARRPRSLLAASIAASATLRPMSVSEPGTTTAPSSSSRCFVGSEVGTLRRVMLHRPGLELRRLTPSTARELLFDGVLWVGRAREEHEEFAAALASRGVEIVYLEDLLTDVLDQQDVRDELVQSLGPPSARTHAWARGSRVARMRCRRPNWRNT